MTRRIQSHIAHFRRQHLPHPHGVCVFSARGKELSFVANFGGAFVDACEIDKVDDKVSGQGCRSQATSIRYKRVRSTSRMADRREGASVLIGATEAPARERNSLLRNERMES